MKIRFNKHFFIFQKEVEKDGLVLKNIFRYSDLWEITIDESPLKGLDRDICKYECVSLFGCFEGLFRIKNINFPTGFNTSNVTDMAKMFCGCNSLTSLNLSTFNTSNVTSMIAMFRGCNSLTSLNLSTFNTSNVTNMTAMFDGCKVSQSLIYQHLIQVELQI